MDTYWYSLQGIGLLLYYVIKLLSGHALYWALIPLDYYIIIVYCITLVSNPHKHPARAFTMALRILNPYHFRYTLWGLSQLSFNAAGEALLLMLLF